MVLKTCFQFSVEMEASGSLSAGTTQPDGISGPYKDLQIMVTSTFPPSLSVLTSPHLTGTYSSTSLGHSWSDQYSSGCLLWGPVELRKNISIGDVWAQAVGLKAQVKISILAVHVGKESCTPREEGTWVV